MAVLPEIFERSAEVVEKLVRLPNKTRRFVSEEITAYWQVLDKKPLSVQMREAWQLARYYRFPPYHYVKHFLFTQAKRNVLDYIPPELVTRYCRRINDKEAVRLVRSKREFERQMVQHRLPVVSSCYFVFKQGVITRETDENVHVPVRYEAFVAGLVERGLQQVFLKPVFGGQANGVRKLNVRPDGIYDGERCLDKTSFFSLVFGDHIFKMCIVQPVIEQHTELSRIYPLAVNSVRIDTFDDHGTIRHNAALLRLGCHGRITDNLSAGGIMVNIDLQSGGLAATARTKARFGTHTMTRHPDTGEAFAGRRVPYWDQVKETVSRAAIALRPVRAIGWDVAITPDGPVLIEANDDYGIFSLQECAGGLRYSPLGREMARYYHWPD